LHALKKGVALGNPVKDDRVQSEGPYPRRRVDYSSILTNSTGGRPVAHRVAAV